jgi:hypothetical protein
MKDLEQQFWYLMDQQHQRDLTPSEIKWCRDNFPEYETLLVAE